MTEPRGAEITVPFDQFHVFSIHAWIEANNYDPFCAVQTNYPGVVLPPVEMAKNVSVLNLAGRATGQTQWMDNEVRTNMRFNGTSYPVRIPYRAMIYFQFRNTDTVMPTPWAGVINGRLGVGVPDTKEKASQASNTQDNFPRGEMAVASSSASGSDVEGTQSTSDTPPPRKRGHLYVVK